MQRSNGQSAIKSASYRHGQRLWDERLQRAFAYKKPDLVSSAIIAPDGAPEWVFRRAELWNRAEMAETRKNAQTAREIEVSIPRELSKAQQEELVHSFFREHFVSRGMVADIAIHAPIGRDGQPQPHAHCMLTKRRLDASTKSGFAKTKSRDWDEDPGVQDALREVKDQFRKGETLELAQRIHELDQQRNINVWRAAWAAAANQALERAGEAARIDHRTLEAQGIKRQAQPHLGLALHIEKAYAFLKDRVSNWLAIVKRNELYRAFQPYQTRDPQTFAKKVAEIASFTDSLMAHWRQRPRPGRSRAPEVER